MTFKMVSKHLILSLILCWSISNAEQLNHFEWTKVSKIFSRENFPDFLGSFNYDEISEKCRDHTTNFAQRLANPIGGLTNNYWHLKSKYNNTFEILNGIMAICIHSFGLRLAYN
jgi:hypothetical protein